MSVERRSGTEGGFKFHRVDESVSCEFNRVAGNGQFVVEKFFQVGEGLTQIIFRVRVGHLAPKQRGEFVAGVGAARHDEVRQQSGDFVGDEVGDGDVISRDLRRAQVGQT
ncbi:MAG: hypothetical protein DPW15_13455 [Chloroflexi bacterium]|nr:hypothetical protein [Chloroflexota bacterium]